MLLKLTILAAKRIFELLKRFTLLFIFTLPEFFLTIDSFDLRLGFIMNFLLSNLELVIKSTLTLFTCLLEFFDLAVEELDLLSKQSLLTARFEFELHCLILNFLELRPCRFEFLSNLSLLSIHLASRLVQICRLPRQSICMPVQLMGQTRNLLVLLEVLTHKPIDSRIQFNSLSFKVLYLPFKRGVLSALCRLKTVFCLVELAF